MGRRYLRKYLKLKPQGAPSDCRCNRQLCRPWLDYTPTLPEIDDATPFASIIWRVRRRIDEHFQETAEDHPPVITRRTAVRQSFLLGISLLAVSACNPQPAPPPAVAGQPITPVSYASGSPANTTRAFDGTFKGLAVQSVAGGSITPGASTASVNCPNYAVASLPPVTISNGLAQFQAIGLTFQGYVTPQGGLLMSSGVGQTFQGQIDSRNVLSGQVLGRCAYNLS
jgi:hypothetical protein